ncbi:MAG TPA: Uma2 family endonuclease, partial [Kofleriaceae bacterium]|nr:Uma2 family endonuclease [Kofleriaceae bacterium]
PRQRYVRAHPTRAWLLIEVADSSLRQDRVLKAEIYAEAGVPEYWMVDVARGAVEVRTEPVAGQYGRLVTIARGESIALVAFPDVTVAVDDFLPPA